MVILVFTMDSILSRLKALRYSELVRKRKEPFYRNQETVQLMLENVTEALHQNLSVSKIDRI